MNSQNRFIIIFGIICLLLGTLAFVDHAMLGVKVDMLQGLLYVSSGLFGFAAVMRGGTSIKRYLIAMSCIYAFISLVGIFQRNGSVLWLFHVNGIENIIHLIFASTLFAATRTDEQLNRWLSRVRRLA
jgi:hypothetical protein